MGPSQPGGRYSANGVLLVDKPPAVTSHDVVSWARHQFGQRAVGHAGTLDPMATGLLVLLVGSATRLSAMLAGKDKTYEAEIRLGWSTDTHDALGEPVGAKSARLPGAQEIRAALDTFVGTFLQMPPAHSAKKVAGQPAYRAARRKEPVPLRPCAVSIRSLDSTDIQGDKLLIRLTVSPGFYVRALARDLGDRLGCGAHLGALRRLRSGSFHIDQATTLAAAEAMGAQLVERLVAPADAMPDLPVARVNEAGLARVRHGNAVSPSQLEAGSVEPGQGAERGETVRILAPDGRLVALGRWRAGALHPTAVLG